MKNSTVSRVALFLFGLQVAALGQVSGVEHQDHFAGNLGQRTERTGGIPPLDVQMFTFDGVVLAANGTPTQGAVVLSDSGGHAISGLNGEFQFQVQVPTDVETVRVTAVSRSNGTLMASQQVLLPNAAFSVSVGALQLSSSSTCSPSWLPTFGELPGTSEAVSSMTVFDDGSGAALYVGGGFESAGATSAQYIAKWDGRHWSPLGAGLDWVVSCMTVFDDGSGEALFVGGYFQAAGGAPASRVAKWDGSNWTAVGHGVNDIVHDLEVFDDGSGPALYAGGRFTTAGSAVATYIAKWDGSGWSALGSGIGYRVYTLEVFDDGGGAELYAGGIFASGDYGSGGSLSKWNGSTWNLIGAGATDIYYALEVFDDGSGPALYAGGISLTKKWDGSTLTSIHNGLWGDISGLRVFDEGSGPALFAAGNFLVNGSVQDTVAKWDGSAWSQVGATGANIWTSVLAVFDDGSGEALYAGGSFEDYGSLAADNIAKWDGSSWSAFADEGVHDKVLALAVFDDGGGPQLFAGGAFTNPGGVAASHVAKWNGSTWEPLGSGVSGSPYTPSVAALIVFDDGTGEALYAAGRFSGAGGVPANHIAKWDGSNWTALGNGLLNQAYCLGVFNDGSGPALFAGGYYLVPATGGTSSVAKWDGTNWVGPGSGIQDYVFSLASFDSGAGERLYAGGNFSMAGGSPANNIAAWDGTSWSPLANGTNSNVSAMQVFDDGGGDALYVGGWFTSAGNVAASSIAKWDGATWTALGNGLLSGVRALTTFDDGSGVALYAGGSFVYNGNARMNRVAKWDGGSWSGLGTGVSGIVFALASMQDCGETLFAGGAFEIAYDSGDSYLARWSCPSSGSGCISFCFGDGSDTSCPCGNTAAPGEGCANSTGAGAILQTQGTLSVATDNLTLSATNLIPNRPALLFGGTLKINAGNGVISGDGLLCLAGSLQRMGVRTPNATGDADWGPGIIAQQGWSVGETRTFQVWYRDTTNSPCGTQFNFSNGVSGILGL